MTGMPTRVLNLPNAATDNSETPATAFAGTGLGAGLNQIIDDAKGTGLKVGSGTSAPSAGKVLRATGVADADGNQQSAWGPVQAGDVAAGAVMKQLAKVTLGVDTATVTFSSISGAYSSLMVEVFARGDKAASADSLLMRVGNGSADAGANYDSQYILGTGVTPSASESFAGTSWSIGGIAANAATAGRVGIARIVLPAYATTTFDKVMFSNYFFCTGTTTGVMQSGQYGGLWRSTAAIDTITILCTSNFKTGSVFTLWGAP